MLANSLNVFTEMEDERREKAERDVDETGLI